VGEGVCGFEWKEAIYIIGETRIVGREKVSQS
jgi:hypothetical protein